MAEEFKKGFLDGCLVGAAVRRLLWRRPELGGEDIAIDDAFPERRMSGEDSKRLTAIMYEEIKAEGPGQHATEPLLVKIFDRCQAAGLAVTMLDIRREFRDSAGYP